MGRRLHGQRKPHVARQPRDAQARAHHGRRVLFAAGGTEYLHRAAARRAQRDDFFGDQRVTQRLGQALDRDRFYLVVMKNYPPQFKADGVALYESRPDATIRSVAADLGINAETLRNWGRAAGVNRPRGRRTQEAAQPPTLLEAENAALRKKVRELEEEREILRKAAKYFAGETRW
ncbi:transposase [Streptomyces sp. NBC_01497]|uniref:transposase n=1 Tax=Streptomyces sp. NBC_01497 TaxID=2903885 RepID=UPI002E302706|nr:transposase [Streptomyces sp. NBC_01497]